MKWMGGERGARKPQSTFYPSLRPGSTPIEQVRQAIRHYNQAPSLASNNASGGGGSGNTGRSDPIGVSEFESRVVLVVPDATTVDYILGDATIACAYFIDYYIRRDAGTPVHTVGRVNVVSDGGNAIAATTEDKDSAAGEAGVSFAADVFGGYIRLNITTTDETPDATATMILYIKQVNIP